MGTYLHVLLITFELMSQWVIASPDSSFKPNNATGNPEFESSPQILTAPPGGVPTSFVAKPRNWGQSLPAIACLMNTVNVIGELALEEFNGMIPRSRIYRYPDYPEVFFTVVGLDGGAIKRSYAILGIYAGLGRLINDKQFRVVTFDLEWNGNLIGFVYFCHQPLTPTSTQTSIETGTVELKASTTATLLNGIRKNVNVSSLDAARLNLEMEIYGPPIPTLTVFLIVLGNLITSAEQRSSGIIELDLDMRVDDVNAQIKFRLPRPYRTRPPFFTYEWVIKSLVELPKFLLKEKKFAETRFKVEVGHSLVATGYLVNYKEPSSSGLDSANISTS